MIGTGQLYMIKIVIIAKKNCDKLQDGELKEFLIAFDDRDTTIGRGFMFYGNHFDVHRFHPQLFYGRRGRWSR